MRDPSPLTELRGITKRFPGIIACDSVDLCVYPGEIHALLGENGAGKTTLMHVLYGLQQPDAGEIWIDDRRRVIRSPREAIRAGIGMVFQHFTLIPSLTVAENIGLAASSAHVFLRRKMSGGHPLAQRWWSAAHELAYGVGKTIRSVATTAVSLSGCGYRYRPAPGRPRTGVYGLTSRESLSRNGARRLW